MKFRLTTISAMSLLFVFSGCTNDPEPILADPASPAASTAVSPPTTSLSTSPTTSIPQNETPEEFVHRVIAISDEMLQDGDTTAYRELTPNCVSCDLIADKVDDTYQGGAHFAGGAVTITNLMPIKTVSKTHIFNLVLAQDATRIIGTDGTVLERFPEETAKFRINVVRKKDGWRLTRMDGYK